MLSESEATVLPAGVPLCALSLPWKRFQSGTCEFGCSPAHLTAPLALSTRPSPLFQIHRFSPQASPTMGRGGPASNRWVWPAGTMPGCSGAQGPWGGHIGNLAGQREARPMGPLAPRVPGGEPLSELVSRGCLALSRGDPLRPVLGGSPGSLHVPSRGPRARPLVHTQVHPLPLLQDALSPATHQPSLWAKEEPSRAGSTVLRD